MNPEVDGTTVLTVAEVCARYEERTGRTMKPKTFISYVCRKTAPAKLFPHIRTPLFDAAAIDEWIDSRPGRGNRTNHPGSRQK